MKCESAFFEGHEPCADLRCQVDRYSRRERKQRKFDFLSSHVPVQKWLTDHLTVDPSSVNPGERASKLRSQQEVCGALSRNDTAFDEHFFLAAPRPCLHLVSSSDQSSSADTVKCDHLMSGLACEERQAHDSW